MLMSFESCTKIELFLSEAMPRMLNVMCFAFYVLTKSKFFLSEAVFLLDVVLWRCNRRNAIMTAAW